MSPKAQGPFYLKNGFGFKSSCCMDFPEKVRSPNELFVRFRREKQKNLLPIRTEGEIPGWLVQSCCLESSHPCTHGSFMCRGGLGWEGTFGTVATDPSMGRFVYLGIHEWLLFLDGKCSETCQPHGWYGYGWSCWSYFFHLWSFEIWWVLSYWV